MRTFLFVFFLLLFVGCDRPRTPEIKPSPIGVKEEYADLIQRNQPKEEEEEVLQEKPEKLAVKKQKPVSTRKLTIKPQLPDEVDTLKFSYAKAEQKVSKKANQRNVFWVNTDTANKLEISLLTADSTANIGIIQILNPDGTQGNQLGKSVLFSLPIRNGNYKITVGDRTSNQPSFEGEYVLKMKLKW
ncbi:Uncharacterised protein [Weeksella virosa]|uniref:hypothetical protein n=1 Tax=Weeksella virosa TaxID=1014 RepID=UPI000E086718|nr:hypothetical protein [Weeksella virosa]SUP54056.1 Uncharacterised protein [Weeksella virosa]